MQNLAEELREAERQLSKLDEGRKNNMIAIRDLEMTKERLLSFAEYAKDAQPEVLVTLIQTIVERIYIVDKDDERYCHIFIKGCSGEDYTGFFQTAGYIEQKTTPVCDSEQYCIYDIIERFFRFAPLLSVFPDLIFRLFKFGLHTFPSLLLWICQICHIMVLTTLKGGYRMFDTLGRKIDYMRISITDRCNLRCKYCMPHEIESIAHTEILRFEEILKICEYAVELGITKFKITGGEPFVRRGCMSFLRDLKSLPNVEQVTLTTNGILLDDHISELRDIGIDGINISLDAAEADTFEKITGSKNFDAVMNALLQCQAAEIKTKVNSVLLKGLNESEFWGLLDLARNYNIDVRFIEVMPIGYGKKYEGFSKIELLKKIRSEYPDCAPVSQKRGNGPASYISIPGFKGCIGFIDAIHGKFCHECNRVRLTSDGFLKPCLYYESSTDLKYLLRNNASKREIMEVMRRTILQKQAEHHFDVSAGEKKEPRKMSQIGG